MMQLLHAPKPPTRSRVCLTTHYFSALSLTLASSWLRFPNVNWRKRFWVNSMPSLNIGHAIHLSGLSVGHVKARLLRRLGRIGEAKAMNEDTLALATGMPDCPDRILRELNGDAALLARDLGDSSAAYRHEMTALEIVRRNVRDRPDVQDIRRLGGAADGAIEAGRLGEADALIAEAELAARAEFGVDSLVYASVLATRGRLKFVKREYKEALNDLERAATMLRNGSPIDHLKLPSVLVHLAQAAQFLGDRRKARLSIGEAYDIDLALYGPDHPETRKDQEIMKDIRLFDLISTGGKFWNMERPGRD